MCFPEVVVIGKTVFFVFFNFLFDEIPPEVENISPNMCQAIILNRKAKHAMFK